jgi:uncharacterized protein YaiE (UPF0345 family)
LFGSGTAEELATITLDASGGATIATGNLTADGTTTTAGDLALTLNLTADTSSTIDMDAFANVAGSITATATGAGNFELGDASSNFTFSDASTFDLSGATGTNYVALVGATGAATVTLASENGLDDVLVEDSALVTIKNFQMGASADTVVIDTSEVGTNVEAHDGGAVAANQSQEITTATTLDGDDSVLVLVGANFATAGLVETALEAGGSFAITTTNAAGDDFLVVWSDGSNSYLGALNVATANTADTIAATDSTMTTMVEFTGVDVSTASTWNNANYALA